MNKVHLTASSEFGIYWVDYMLINSSGNVTQVTYEAERFAVRGYEYEQ